ncbi:MULTISPECIES: DISARM system phospholipase D-like protein DrmC [Streptomyces]|uniref:Phospholipase n=2 Tax=Streptomyces TaxID=1883 RepID=A0A3R7FKG6_9ACTN|nr:MULTISPECIES: DISARM system phospholipase D-like protein DrmC [Streptomyces]KNE82409.1 phospholipase [Streptomyces fradiae]OFA52498.1 phospholipase [Streptomyces fradiae]PQM19671.1 phospholipase [Streptomyces xinghaiensis]RKM91034.1 phospholipase [Streptomyces xinghaiensis]RNC72358.1 phospholipase [Streptomyces xinghaiensis]
MSDADAPRQLGSLLTGTEAKDIADRLADGETLTTALKVVAVGQRAEVRRLLEAVSDGPGAAPRQILVLRAIEGARAHPTALTPLWTMPGHLAQSGPLTTSVPRLVDSARHAITCSTFNFQRSSALWTSLRTAAQQHGVALRVYMDTRAADGSGQDWSPSTTEVAAHLAPAEVWRTKEFDGEYVRNHAKFLAIDHRLLLVTSANLSWSAENNNVEFGVLIDNPNLTEAVERELREAEGALYERV